MELQDGLKNAIDLDLVIRCKDGDIVAQQVLYERYRPQIYKHWKKMCYRFPTIKIDKDDYFQDAFLFFIKAIENTKADWVLENWHDVTKWDFGGYFWNYLMKLNEKVMKDCYKIIKHLGAVTYEGAEMDEDKINSVFVSKQEETFKYYEPYDDIVFIKNLLLDYDSISLSILKLREQNYNWDEISDRLKMPKYRVLRYADKAKRKYEKETGKKVYYKQVRAIKELAHEIK